MSAENTKQHFAEICECIWDKIQQQEKLDKKAAAAMRRFIANFTMIAWNACIMQKTYSDVKKFLTKFAEEKFGGEHHALQSLLDAAELKWREYRDDKDIISYAEVKQINGKPQAIAYLKDESPDVSAAFKPFHDLMNSPEIQERLKNTPPDKLEEEIGKIVAEYNASLPPPLPFIVEDEEDDDEFDDFCDIEVIEEEYDFDPKNLHVLQLQVDLVDYDVSVELLVPEDATFDDLHTVLNSIFKRDDDHLFHFETEDGCTIVRIAEELEDIEKEEGAMLAENCYVGHHLSEDCGAYYLFDYGDEWEHDITVKKVIPVKKKDCKFKLLQITGEIPEQYPDYDDDEN
ncbi:MAG: hypothetical protein J6W00_10010 [Lentisphaeria bacterium]|nr:hypothetical protein [Lentisphaeria bacterium]